jgi:hypothetical protein
MVPVSQGGAASSGLEDENTAARLNISLIVVQFSWITASRYTHFEKVQSARTLSLALELALIAYSGYRSTRLVELCLC